MKVKEMAASLGVTADTVRYYTRIGFLAPDKNSVNGYKEYNNKDLQRLRFILSARKLGFTVNDIEEILSVAGKGETPCPLVRRLIVHRLEETREQFLQSVALRQRMQSAVEEWKDIPDKEPDGHMICHLIENFMPKT